MYIADYSEKTSSEFFVGTAVGYTKRDEGDGFQRFNITVFYPINDEKPCYIPRLESNQIISIANSKFSIASKNELDVSFYFLFFRLLFYYVLIYVFIYYFNLNNF
jgi:hypothetical protein